MMGNGRRRQSKQKHLGLGQGKDHSHPHPCFPGTSATWSSRYDADCGLFGPGSGPPCLIW